MAEAQTVHQDKGCGIQSAGSAGEAAFCPSCKEAYWWMYGEERIPTSLSCGHTLCIRSTSAAGNNIKDSQSEPGVSTAAGDKAIAVAVAASQTTPITLKPSTDVAQHAASGGQAACSVVYSSSERVASSLSSPMVLDKIQSQDDAWRLLQHDEGFIRDWIVANVPDHVIFKMVGAGNPDTVVATSVDNSSFILSSNSTVVISSPPNTTENCITSTKSAGITSSGCVPAMSAFLGENSVGRSSFEQQFLHYLVNKSSQERPQDSDEENTDDLPPGSGEGNLQDGQGAGPEHSLGSAAGSQIKESSTKVLVQRLDRSQPGGVGNKGDCGVQRGKDLQQMGFNRMVRISADGEASQLATAEAKTRQLLPPGYMSAETAAYGSVAGHQSMSAHHKQPAVNVYVPPHPGSGSAAYPSAAPNLQYPQYPPALSENAGIYAAYPRKMAYPGGGGGGGEGKGLGAGPYGSHPYPSPYPLHSQYGPQYTVAHRYGPHHFQQPPQYLSHRRARPVRGRGTSFHRFYPQSPMEQPWYSKACGNSLSLSPVPRLSSQPQIRFVQVLRPKSENVWEQSAEAKDLATTAKEVQPDTANTDPLQQQQSSRRLQKLKWLS